jgi:hypothetical protein
MTDPVIAALISEERIRNRDVKFAGEERLRDGVIVRRYVGVVDASSVSLLKRLTDTGVPVSDLRFSHDTDGEGMQLSIISRPGAAQTLEYKSRDRPLVYYLVVLCVLCKFVVDFSGRHVSFTGYWFTGLATQRLKSLWQ